MTGYVICHGTCCACHAPVAFNPYKVPSVRIEGKREPVCQTCVTEANAVRAQKGIAPLIIEPDAYEPLAEDEL